MQWFVHVIDMVSSQTVHDIWFYFLFGFTLTL